MEIFTGRHNDFANDFYKQVREYTLFSYNKINQVITADASNYYQSFFKQEEIVGLIIINKNFFQNIFGFFALIDSKLPLPAFNALRSAIEILRLFRVYYYDKDFRVEYLNNSNLDFRSTPDYDFMQKKINDILFKQEAKIRSSKILYSTPLLDNHELLKGSAISELHSELSKWSHMLNVNLIFPPHITQNKIYLGINDTYNQKMQGYLLKYTEGIYVLVTEHIRTLGSSNDFLDTQETMMDLYSEYIKLFYKN